MRQAPTLYKAAGAADAQGAIAAPASLLCEHIAQGVRVLAIGSPDAVAHHPAAASATPIDLGESILTPAFVNCHTHLDLTHVGPRAFDPAAEFRVWLDMVLRERATEADAIRRSVALGVNLSRSGGVIGVGDIAGIGRIEALAALRDSDLLGVSFLEFFGMGRRQDAVIAAMHNLVHSTPPHPRVRLGLQPHAPYSAGLRVYAAAAELARLATPLCTHLAESAAEHEFIAHATGPMRGLIERLGVWDDSILEEVGRGDTPVAHLLPALAGAPCLFAHCNDCSDADLAALARSAATVVYCPRSSAYFGHHLRFGPHRYRDMLAKGIRVVLGTDSIINVAPAESDRLTPLDEARFLYRRDAFDPRTLLRMITADAAETLGLAAGGFRFPRDAEAILAGIARVNVSGTPRSADPLARIMQSSGPAPLLEGAPRA